MRYIIGLFLSKNNISIHNEELNLQLLSHPNYPSIIAISDLFTYFNIDNLVIEVPQTISILNQLPKFFLAHIEKENGEKSIVLIEKTLTQLKLIFDNDKEEIYSFSNFIKIWSGIIIVIENNTNKAIITKKTANISIKIFFALALLVLLFAILKSENLNLSNISYFLLAIIGAYISFLLIQKELGIQSKNVDKFCKATKQSNCDAVINSKGATLFKSIKLSDVSFIYFLSILMFFSIYFITNNQLPEKIIFITSLASVFVIPYSLYYQWKVIKQWCPLCILIIFTLIIQLLIVLFLFSFNTITIYSINTLIFSISVVALLWLLSKPLLQKKEDYKDLELAHLKFTRNPTLFSKVLESSKPITTTINVNEIVIGNTNAPLEIILITNPLCHFCKKAHQIIDSLLKNREDKIKLTIRFNININIRENNVGLQAAAVLLSIHSKQAAQKTLNALNEIYANDVDIKKWLKQQQKTDEENYIEVLKAEKDWCTQNNINFTPALLINNFLYPKEYKITDLPYFIDELVEKFT